MSKVIAIAFSDLHLNIWAKFNKDNKRTQDSFRVLFKIIKECEKYDVPALFCGDLFHKPENLDLDLALMFRDFMKEVYHHHPKFKMFCIAGNHELKSVNSLIINDNGRYETTARSWLDVFENDHPITILSPSTPAGHIGMDVMIHGVPYIDHNIGMGKYLKSLRLMEGFKHILLLHTDYPGAKDTDGRVIDSAENINLNMLNRFDLVLCGHIHKPQRLSKKVYMIGAPIQQRRTDKDCKMGYWLVMDDMSMKFVELKGFPKFIDVESEEDIKDDGNYYTVLPKKSSSEKVEADHKITKQLSKKRLAKRYMKQKGINDKKKEDLLINVLKESEV